VDINIPKPSITLDLKVKEEKIDVQKDKPIKVSKSVGVAKVKSKSRNHTKRKSHHYYNQKVMFGTILKNTVSKLKRKVKKTTTKKPVFSVVCCTF
jgi:hypothetical protein